MALDKLVDSTQLDSDLTDVADEIRTAGGTLLPLSFPDDYVAAIGDIGNTEIKTASGSIAHFEDALARKAQDLTVDIEPVQDLHGYDNPWPAGGGKNLYDASIITGQGSAGNYGVVCTVSNGVINLNGTATSNAYFSVIGLHLPSGNYAISANNPIGTNGVHLALRDENGNYYSDSGLSKTNYKVLVSSRDINTVIIYVKQGTQLTNFKLQPQVEVGTATTSWTPYSNICPISGWTGANVTRTGKNLLQPGLSPSATGNSTATPTASGGYVLRATATGGWLWNRINVLPAKPFAGKRLIFSFDISIDHDQNPQTIFALRNSDGVVSSKTVNYSASRLSAYLDIPANVTDDHFISMTLYVTTSVSASVGWETTYSNLQIEIVGASETAPTAYEPYNANTYSITFPTSAGTVYGGTLDVTTGKLTVDRAKRTLNGSENWAGTPNSGWYTPENSLKKLTSYVGHMMADTLPAGVPGENSLYGYIDIRNTYPGENWIYYKNSNLTSVAEVKAFFAANPTEVVYKLATPIVYDLTPTEVTTLLGTNNVWADTGDSTIQYIAHKAQIPSAQGVYF